MTECVDGWSFEKLGGETTSGLLRGDGSGWCQRVSSQFRVQVEVYRSVESLGMIVGRIGVEMFEVEGKVVELGQDAVVGRSWSMRWGWKQCGVTCICMYPVFQEYLLE